MIITFKDKTKIKITKDQKKAINMKYHVEPKKYIEEAKKAFGELYQNKEILPSKRIHPREIIGKTITMERLKDLTMAEHFKKCIEIDLQMPMLGIQLQKYDKELIKKGEKPTNAKIIGIDQYGNTQEYP